MKNKNNNWIYGLIGTIILSIGCSIADWGFDWSDRFDSDYLGWSLVVIGIAFCIFFYIVWAVRDTEADKQEAKQEGK